VGCGTCGVRYACYLDVSAAFWCLIGVLHRFTAYWAVWGTWAFGLVGMSVLHGLGLFIESGIGEVIQTAFHPPSFASSVSRYSTCFLVSLFVVLAKRHAYARVPGVQQNAKHKLRPVWIEHTTSRFLDRSVASVCFVDVSKVDHVQWIEGGLTRSPN